VARRLPKLSYPGNVRGLLYEPRAFWSVHQVNTADNPGGRIVLPREHFLNGEPYPINLTHLTFAPINYTFREFENGAPVDAATYHNCMAGGLRSDILIGAPQRQSYARQVLRIPSWTARPRWEPQISGTATPWASSLWNTTRWDFDHSMIIPEQGSMEFQLSCITPPTGVFDPPVANPEFSVGIYEGPPPGKAAPGALLMPGNMRIGQQKTMRYAGTVVRPPPFEGDGFGIAPIVATPGKPGVATQLWPTDQQLSAREYDAQNATQAGSTPVTGFGVHIDQIDYDDTVINTNLIGALGAPAGQPITPLSLRTGVRARMHNGGTGNWWWRPWAPLALVSPSMTPAQVYKFPVAITLGPGDNLEIELQTPGPVNIEGNDIDPLYQVGIGMCGYAAIEG
jgi:hypothetical protein